jgi:hypothetical protein
MEGSFDFSSWTVAELARAASTADEYLTDNGLAISHVLSRQCAVLDRLVATLKRGNLTLEQRLECFARIAEVSEGLQTSAKGFFELGSGPLVARLLAKAELP